MNLRHLQAFVEIVDSGSVSAAARVLGTAQPSLSLLMKQLESDLGAQLFIRKARGVIPTDAGKRFYSHAKSIIESVESSKEAVKGSGHVLAGDIAVALGPLVSRALAPSLIIGAAQRYPEIVLNIQHSGVNLLHSLKGKQSADVGLIYSPPNKRGKSGAIIEEDLFLISSPESLTKKRATLPFSDLAKTRLIAPNKPHIFWDVIAALDNSLKLTPSVWFDAFSRGTVTKLCHKGYSYVLPRVAVADELKEGLLVAIPIVNPTPSVRISIEVSKNTRNPDAAQAVGDMLRHIVTDLVEKGEWNARFA